MDLTKYRKEARRIAALALGKPLPNDRRVPVHHMDENPMNNTPSNLVICQDSAYHRFLHVRIDAKKATGDKNKRRCYRCKEYFDVSDLYVWGKNSGHMQECVDCKNRRIKELEERMKPRMKEIKKRWNAANPDKVRAMKRKEYQKNRDRYIERAKEWRAKHKEEHNE